MTHPDAVEREPEDTTIAVRLTHSFVEVVDAHRSALCRGNPGVSFTRSDAVRSLLAAGAKTLGHIPSGIKP